MPLAILAALLLVGQADTPISPIESDNHSYQLIELSSLDGLKNSFSVDVDNLVTANETYAAVMFNSNMEEINYNQKFNIEG